MLYMLGISSHNELGSHIQPGSHIDIGSHIQLYSHIELSFLRDRHFLVLWFIIIVEFLNPHNTIFIL